MLNKLCFLILFLSHLTVSQSTIVIDFEQAPDAVVFVVKRIDYTGIVNNQQMFKEVRRKVYVLSQNHLGCIWRSINPNCEFEFQPQLVEKTDQNNQVVRTIEPMHFEVNCNLNLIYFDFYYNPGTKGTCFLGFYNAGPYDYNDIKRYDLSDVNTANFII